VGFFVGGIIDKSCRLQLIINNTFPVMLDTRGFSLLLFYHYGFDKEVMYLDNVLYAIFVLYNN